VLSGFGSAASALVSPARLQSYALAYDRRECIFVSIDEHDAPRRRDLAAMIVPLGRDLMAAELPVLRAHDISMWGYAVLLALGERPTRTQVALAAAIGADKTRVIPVLDELQDRGLIERRPDPADRRAHLLSVTPSGKRLRESVQRDIQRREERLLSRLPPGDRAAFLRALQTLAALPPAQIRQGEDSGAWQD
jgi:DNA-binding MarR family transcriptional regulator